MIKKINFTGYFPTFDYRLSDVYKILSKNFEVEISDNPDYIFCGCYDNYDFCNNSHAIRIMYTFEYYLPNFNVLDYAINCFSNISFEDRSTMFHSCLYHFINYEKRNNCTREELKQKNAFCNMIYSHNGYLDRDYYFNLISTYKRVDSAGAFMNNMNGFTPGPRHGGDAGIFRDHRQKVQFQSKYKFSMAFENAYAPYYWTEKIIHAYLAKTIPIYRGDKRVFETLNKKCCIYADEMTDKQLLARIREIDQNDDLFLSIVNEPLFNDPDFVSKSYKRLEEFLMYIFTQDLEHARRRSKVIPLELENLRLGKFQKVKNNKYKFYIFRLLSGRINKTASQK